MGDKLHFSKRAQIAHMKVDKALTKDLGKYIDFADVFLSKLAIKLLKHMRINNHAIKLVDNWQSSYGSIYYLALIKLKTLKIYIKNNLVNNFIRLSKFFARRPIFFNKKPDKYLRLCVNYQYLNNLTIKNSYFLPLIVKLLDQLD